MKDETLKDKLDSYSRPANCQAISQCRVNPEICPILKTDSRVLDSKLQKDQQLFLTAATPITRAADELLSPATADVSCILKLILDAIAFLGAANVELNSKRRELIRPELSKAYKPLCSEEDDAKPSALLFGDNLPQRCKELRDTHKMVLGTRSPAPPGGVRRSSSLGAASRGIQAVSTHTSESRTRPTGPQTLDTGSSRITTAAAEHRDSGAACYPKTNKFLDVFME